MTTEEHGKAVTVAAINWAGKWGNKSANLAKIKTLIRDAAQSGVKIVCFPEMALSGMDCSEDIEKTHKPCSMHTVAAETIPGPSSTALAELTKELGIYVIVGMPERDAKDPDIIYNSSAIMGPEGIMGSYRKLHLGPTPMWTESMCFKPGNELPVFETRYGLIAVQICADFWDFPEVCRILLLKGVRIIFNPTASAAGPGKAARFNALTLARAMEDVAYVVCSNHTGKDRVTTLQGRSAIAGPAITKPSAARFARIMAQAEDFEEIVTATLSLEAQDYARKIRRTHEKGNWNLIAEEFTRIAKAFPRK